MNYSCGGDTMQRERERERECDSCRSAPAAVYCRADAAALCAACDADIHAANPISRRHHRVPVGGGSSSNYGDDESKNYEEVLFGEEVVDEYLDHLVEFNAATQNIDGTEQAIKNEAAVTGERVVPVQQGLVLLPLPKKSDHDHNGMEEYEDSSSGFCYSAPHSHSVSLSSMEASHIVPDSTDDSNPYAQPPKGTMELFSSPLLHVPSQFSPMDREARVLRYREKKKNRKFEKTIRYASRKAYAEARPRIKGRFAKRTDLEELEVDRMFSDYAIPEDSFGIVPSF